MSRGSHRQRWQWIATRSATAADCSATQFGQSAFLTGLSLFVMAHSLRKRVLEEWRGLPEPEQKADRLLPIRDVLNQLAPKLGLEARLRRRKSFPPGSISSAISSPNIPARLNCTSACWSCMCSSLRSCTSSSDSGNRWSFKNCRHGLEASSSGIFAFVWGNSSNKRQEKLQGRSRSVSPLVNGSKS